MKLVNGKTMYDGGQFCSNYYSFGANVVAPIYGEVVKVVNHINDIRLETQMRVSHMEIM